MPADVVDVIDSYTIRSVVIKVAVEAKGTEVANQFAAEDWGGLATAPVAGAVRAH